ncbi:MAG: hypothetical protein JWN98_2424 [Abditibacteriota bacterium]|jgi:hypothetical protein|nr:hypothetical protein [Abditibacteriota bacterium]
MRRRDFMKASVATAAVSALSQTQAAAALNAAENGKQEFYELRSYSLKPGVESQSLDNFLRDAAIPAWNRLGSQPVGVFTPRDNAEAPRRVVLIPHPSLEAFTTAPARLAADTEFQKAGAAYLDLPSSDPAYVRFESSLLRAFAGMPKIELPPYAAQKKPRLFELRTYESHSEKAALKKIEMFNNGEIDIMRRVGLGPVFYGEMLIGTRLPNLTYLLSAEDDAAHKQHWTNFGGDAEWKRISAIPEYANSKIVSKITNLFLLPTPYSQI